ncbi:Subtilisin-like protease [Dendrobium catenatum]|uniref:Subtilisin-like protease n=1 Tax=Dendrobium catenatum TaxID=906689 RepID=A0A2I0VWE5_9ASPA|nr:Subtilisin-like protease [Dendrobium catenatum]
MSTSDKMINSSFRLLWGILILSIPYSASLSKVHIVYLGHNHGNQQNLTTKFHIKLLSKVFSREDEAKEAMLYSYWHSFSGFAASLNSTQASKMAKMKEVISIFRSKTLKLHTTRSWDFMGLPLFSTETTPMQLEHGDDVVIGIFDTGIWPESESFQPEPTLGPIPATWRGRCVAGENFNPATACNRKLVGARYYLAGFEREYGPLNATGSEAEFRSPRDRLGHGTHTASTAAGSPSINVSYLGNLAAGTARGGAPRARLAVYKVCFQGRCSDADILAAFDDAIADGVGVISASLGAPPPLMPFFQSSIDIGAFHASQVGVSVVFSAGNDGPETGVVQNVSPWVITVAAGTIDRGFPTMIVLGNKASFMVIVLPTVQILPSKTTIGHLPAPSVAHFSSRGPSSVSPNILKPDITAPGVNILAAWPPRSINWNFDSGTSMACPHISGIVALIKSVHPNWSPAAIKSALMTTAYSIDTSSDIVAARGTVKPSDSFDIGAGHVNPLKATDPGLIYDMETQDYVMFLCSLGYQESQINKMILPSQMINISCHGNHSDIDLNYPAITISDLRSTMTIRRTVHNVGQANAIYYVSVIKPQGVHVMIWPNYLVFSKQRKKITYYVTITPLKSSQGRYDFGEIVWFDGYHHVKTPLIVQINKCKDETVNLATHSST